MKTAQYDGDKILSERQFDFNLNGFGSAQSPYDGKVFFCTDDSFNFVTTASPTQVTPTTSASSASASNSTSSKTTSNSSLSTKASNPTCTLGPDLSPDHGEITVYSPTPNGGNCDLPWDFYSNLGLPTMQFFAALPKNPENGVIYIEFEKFRGRLK